MLVDDSEERFSEDQVNLMLDIVQTELLGQTNADSNAEEGDQTGENEDA